MNEKSDRPAVNWMPVGMFMGLAIVLSSSWAWYARAHGLFANPQTAALAAAVAQAGVLVAALVTMRLLARDAFRQVGWRPGPWTVYLKVLVVVMVVASLLAVVLVLGFQRLKGGRETPADAPSPFVAIPVLLVFAGVCAFAEEFGWRGFLLPKLLPLGVRPALLWSGACWFCWEAPLVCMGLVDATLIGVNLPLKLLCHFFGTGALAVSFGYLRLRFDSVFLPTFAHGLLNALGGASILFFTEANPIWSDFGGPVGTALALVVAGLVWRQVGRDLESGQLSGLTATSAVDPDDPRTARATNSP